MHQKNHVAASGLRVDDFVRHYAPSEHQDTTPIRKLYDELCLFIGLSAEVGLNVENKSIVTGSSPWIMVPTVVLARDDNRAVLRD
jgi:hypothetical protein